MPSKPLLAAALASALLAVPAAASAAQLGQSSLPTPVRAYRGEAVWSAAPAGSKTFTLMLSTSAGVRALPVTSAHGPVEADVSRGPSGTPAIVVAACPGHRCGLYVIDPATGVKTRVAATSDARTPAQSPVLWGRRLAWIEARKGGDRIFTATVGRHDVREVRSPVRGARLWELGLFGQRLAVSLNSGHPEGDTQVWLQELDGSRRRLVRKVSSGEADRALMGLSFDGGDFYFAQVCSGDPSGCKGHGTAYRYGSGRLATASVPLDLAGFALTGGQAYWVTENFGACLDAGGEDAPCTVQQSSLTFTP